MIMKYENANTILYTYNLKVSTAPTARLVTMTGAAVRYALHRGRATAAHPTPPTRNRVTLSLEENSDFIVILNVLI